MPFSGSPAITPVLDAVVDEFFQNDTAYVARRIAPVINTPKRSGKYFVFDKENIYNLPRLPTRAPGTAYPRLTLQMSDDLYSTEDRGVAIPIDDVERAEYAGAIDLAMAAMERCVTTILYNEDLRIKELADGLANTSAITTNWNSGTEDPRADVRVARDAIYDATGAEPNTVVMNRAVRDAILDSPSFVDYIKYVQDPFGLGTGDIARFLGVPNVVIAGAIENTANQGQAASLSSMWGDDVLIAHVTPGPNLRAPNWARTFSWTGAGALQKSTVYRDEDAKSDIFRVEQYTGEKVTGAALAYLLTGALS